MRRISSIFNSKKIPWACLLCVLSLLGLELFTRRYIEWIRTSSDNLLVAKDRYISETTEDFDGLIIGDSRVLGLNARWMEMRFKEDLGHTVSMFNLAYPNQGGQSYYFVLKKYLSLGKRPKLIVFSISPTTMEAKWDLNSPGMSEGLYRFARIFTLEDAYAAGGMTLFTRALLIKAEYMSYFLTYRGRIKNLASRTVTVEDMQDTVRRAVREERGAIVIGRLVGVPSLAEIRQSTFYAPLVVSDVSVYWIDRFLKLAGENGIRVIVVGAPLIAPVYEAGEENRSNEKYNALMSYWANYYEHVYLIEPLLVPYPVADFADVQHLNEPGIARFSIETTERLVDLLKTDQFNF